MAIVKPDLCLVSGVSGFVGAAVALQFLREGYRVRGTVRSKAKVWLTARRSRQAQAADVTVTVG